MTAIRKDRRRTATVRTISKATALIAVGSLAAGLLATTGAAPTPAQAVAHAPGVSVNTVSQHVWGTDLAIDITFAGAELPQHNRTAAVVLPTEASLVDPGTLGAPIVYQAGETLPGALQHPAEQTCEALGLATNPNEANTCLVAPGTQYLVFQGFETSADESTHTLLVRPNAAQFGIGSTLNYQVNGYAANTPGTFPVFPGSTSPQGDASTTTLATTVAQNLAVSGLRITQHAETVATNKDGSPAADVTGNIFAVNVYRTAEAALTQPLLTTYLPEGVTYLGSCGSNDERSIAYRDYAVSLDPAQQQGGSTSVGADCFPETSITQVRGILAEDGTFTADENGTNFTQVTWDLTEAFTAPGNSAAQQFPDAAGQAGMTTVRYRVAGSAEGASANLGTVAMGHALNGADTVQTFDSASTPIAASTSHVPAVSDGPVVTDAELSVEPTQDQSNHKSRQLAVADFTPPSEPHLAWRVVDEDNNPVGGATVNVRGPRTTYFIFTSWDGPYEIEDCMSASCVNGVGDIDPRPGHFAVVKLTDSSTVNHDRRYGIQQGTAPTQLNWVNSSSWKDIPPSSRNANSPSVSEDGWAHAGFDFGDLVVQERPSLSWSVQDGESFVGGGTVEVRLGNSSSNVYKVSDCVSHPEPCGADSSDVDNRPGQFTVYDLKNPVNQNSSNQAISKSQTYSINLSGRIDQYSWDMPATVLRLPEANGNWNQPNYAAKEPLKVHKISDVPSICIDPKYASSYYSLERVTGSTMQILRMGLTGVGTGVPGIKNNPEGEMIQKPFSHSGTANALGVTETGVFYFTGQTSVQGRDQAHVYRYDPQVESEPKFQKSISVSLGGENIVSGDATMFEGREEFYFAFYSDGRTEDLGSVKNDYLNVNLHRYSHGNDGRTGKVARFEVLKPKGFGDSYNGDFSFDAYGNLHFIISNTGNSSAENNILSGSIHSEKFENLPVVSDLSKFTPLKVENRVPGSVTKTGINGVTFSATGFAILQRATGTVSSPMSENAVATIPGFVSSTMTEITSGSKNNPEAHYLVDLASCAKPPTITVQKNVIGDRVDKNDNFTLNAEHVGSGKDGKTTVYKPVTTTGTSPGIQTETIGPVVVTLDGTFRASESVNNPNSEYITTRECVATTPSNKKLILPLTTGANEHRNLGIDLNNPQLVGAAIVCTFTNEGLLPRLETSKSSDPASSSVVREGDKITYRLDFSNQTGGATATVNHVDDLTDVLDNLEIDENSFGYTSDAGAGYESAKKTLDGFGAHFSKENKNITVQGTVPAGEHRTVWFTGTVKFNADGSLDNNDQEELNTDPTVINNYLTPAGEEPPAVCEPTNQNCTTHPVQAWSIEKFSQVFDDQLVPVDGNVTYTVSVNKVGAQDQALSGIKIVDDMSDVMKVSRMSSAERLQNGALAFNVQTFNANGEISRDFSTSGSGWDGDVAFNTEQLFPSFLGGSEIDPTSSAWEWKTEFPAFTLLADEVRADITYTVNIGGAADPTNRTQFLMDGNALRFPAANLSSFENTVWGSSTEIPPINCTAETAASDPICNVLHQVEKLDFAIQKNSTAQGVDGSLVMGLAGAKFIIQDTVAQNTWPAGLASANLCHTNYKPELGDGGTWKNGDPVGTFDSAATLDIGEDSATYRSLLAYNNYLLEMGEPLVPMCARMFEIHSNNSDTYQQPVGTWYVENLAPGSYQLVETKAPAEHQLLAETIPFVVHTAKHTNQLSLLTAASAQLTGNDIVALPELKPSPPSFLDRCVDSQSLPSNGTLSCVENPGFLLHVYDAKYPLLPLSGGNGIAMLSMGGVLVLIAALGGTAWFKRRQKSAASL